MNVVIVGAGVIGEHHAKVVAALPLTLLGFADVDRTRAAKLAATFGGRAEDSLSAFPDAEIAVICTPTGLHGVAAIEALRSGCHVVVEKPAETTVARIDEIIAARDEAGKLVTVISQHRFDPAYEQVQAAIVRHELGRITSGVASIDWWRGQTYYDSGDWRGTWALDGGGALMNQGVHTVDLLAAALGNPVEVFAYTGTLAHERIEVEDVATAVVKFEGGALGVLHATTAAYPGLSARLQIHGDRGSAVIDNDRLAFLHTTAPGAEVEERFMGSTQAVAAAASDPRALSDAHRLQYLNFLAALDGTEPLRVDLEANRRSVAVITGAYESARTGRPVSL